MIHYFKKYAQTMYNNGYSIIPLIPKKKNPLIKEWQTKYRNITQHQLDEWLKAYPSYGVGVQTFNTPAIDIDVTDEKIVRLILDEINPILGDGMILTRIGFAPKLIIPCQLEGKTFKKLEVKFHTRDEEEHKLEILAEGQQFVSFGYHKDAKKDYHWANGKSLLEVKRTELPMLDYALATEIRKKVEHVISKNTDWKIENSTVATGTTIDFENVRPPINQTSQQLKAALKHINADDRDIWIKVGMGLHHQYQGDDEGFNLWDNWSQSSHKYKASEMRSKWNSFKSDNTRKAVTAATIIALANHSKKQADGQKIKDFFNRYVWVSADATVVDLKAPPSDKPRPWKVFVADTENEITVSIPKGKDDIKQIPIAKYWRAHKNRQSVSDLCYVPSHGKFVEETYKGTKFRKYNTFYFPDHEKPKPNVKTDFSVFYRHINYLFPKQKEAEWFLDWMSFNVQCPHLRSPVAPLHVSIHQRTGRGSLVKLLTKLLGKHNVTEENVDAFAEEGSRSQFNSYLYRSLLCTVSELKETEKRHFTLADRIKSVITDEYQSYNLKGIGGFSDVCYTNLFFMSNHIDAIVLRSDDGRLNVFINEQPPKKESYYTELHKWIDNPENVSALFYHLKERKLDIEAFKSQRVMKTEARALMIESTTSDFESEFNYVISDLGLKWVTAEHLYSIMVNRLSNGRNSSIPDKMRNQIIQLLNKNPNVTRLSKVQFKMSKDRVVRPWCLDPKAKNCSPEELKQTIIEIDEKIAEMEKTTFDEAFTGLKVV